MSSPFFLFEVSRALLDSGLMLFVTLAIIFAQLARKHAVWWLAVAIACGLGTLQKIPLGFLMLVIEPISHLARIMSLTIRLYGNMFAGDMVILVFLSLIPIGVPVLFVGLHIGVAFIQAYVFVLLTTVYLAGAVATDH